MAARKVLTDTVALRHPKTFEVEVFFAGEAPPAWARKLIKNQNLLVTEAEFAGETAGSASSTTGQETAGAADGAGGAGQEPASTVTEDGTGEGAGDDGEPTGSGSD